ncbi:MAG TPA: hypothetical protein VFQ58_01295 [Flavisolibacter sp.]|nr:hypothetical protein [Flavisolibacter sp.]
MLRRSRLVYIKYAIIALTGIIALFDYNIQRSSIHYFTVSIFLAGILIALLITCLKYLFSYKKE